MMKMQYGPIIKEYEGFFLRDDTQIRRDSGTHPEQAYSLFQKDPYKRVIIFSGSEDWAVAMADKEVEQRSVPEIREDEGNSEGPSLIDRLMTDLMMIANGETPDGEPVGLPVIRWAEMRLIDMNQEFEGGDDG